MRAARFHGLAAGLRVEDVPYPTAGPDDVVVRVAACGVCGSDVHFFEDVPVPAPLPIVLGHEPAGVIESVGANVRAWKAGDRVAIHLGTGCGECATCRSGHGIACRTLRAPGLHFDGAFAEAIRVPTSCLVRVPDAVSLAAAAVATDCVASPYHALKCRAAVRPGETVVVIGVGGLGAMGVASATLLGAARVLAVDLSPTALERATKLGADVAIHVKPGEDVAAQIVLATGGGADVTLECVGVPETVSLGVRTLRPGGRLAIVGVGMQPPKIDLPQALFCIGEISVLGSFGSHREDLEEVLAYEASGRLDIAASISHRLPLERTAEAIEILRTKRGDPQRVVIEVAQALR